MAFKYREEIVGKRFLSLRSQGKLKISRICDWDWRAGVIRAVSHKNASLPDLQVLVEFDDRDWQRREWIRIYDIFTVFLVESSLVWIQRNNPYKAKAQKIWWPALNYTALVDQVGLNCSKHQPVECLHDAKLEYVDQADTRPFKDDIAGLPGPAKDLPEVRDAIHEWTEYQDGQSILLTTPSVLVGERVQVYRAEGTTQWYTAVIKSYNDTTKELNIVDDTVLEEHNEDPAVIQMILLGDGVVDSILRGIDVGSTPRNTRRACTSKEKEKDQSQGHYSNRPRPQSPTHTAQPTKAAVSRKPRQKSSASETLPEVIEKPREKSPEKVAKPKSTVKERKRKVVATVTASLTSKKVKPGDKSPEKTAVVALDDIGDRLREPVKTKTKDKKERKPRSASAKRETVPESEGPVTPPVSGDIKPLVEESSSSVAAVKKAKRARPSKKSTTTSVNIVEQVPSTTTTTNATTADTDTDICNKLDTNKKQKPKTPATSVCQEPANKEKKSRRKRKESKTCSGSNTSAGDSVSGLGQNEPIDFVHGDSACSPGGDEMHYKKLHLLSGSDQEEKKKTTGATGLSASINVNHSVTDQVAKLSGARVDRMYENPDSNQSTASTTVYNNESAGSVESCPTPQTTNTSRVSETSPLSVKREENTAHHPTEDSDRAHQRHNVSGEMRKSSPKTSASSSPLVPDKNETVTVWRDPDLIKKDTEARQQIVSLQHQQQGSAMLSRHLATTSSQQASSYPSVHTPIPHGISSVGQQPSQHQGLVGGASAAAAATAANTRILTPIPYPVTMSAGLAPHLIPHAAAAGTLAALNHYANDPLAAAAARQQQLQLQYQHLLHEQQRLSASYQSLHPNVTAAQLELLWQQKYPQVPLPPPWMLAQFQDDLVRDMSLLRERELLAERDRAERERLERERKERERLEREKAEKDRLERERVERERAERERAEKERQERLERERRQERERIIRESKSADVAVNQHFTESLRLASQKAQSAGTWMPSITLGLPKPPVTTSGGSDVARNLTKSSAEKTRDQKEVEEKLKQERELDQAKRQQRYELEKKFQEAFHHDVLLQTQESLLKRGEAGKLQQQQQLQLQQQQHEEMKRYQLEYQKMLHLAKTDQKLAEQLMKMYPYLYAVAPAGSTASSTLAAYASNATASSIKQETPTSFSLYGYQPYQHSFMSQEKLLTQLEKSRSDYVKETGSSGSVDVKQGSGSGGDKKRGLTSPPPLIKDNLSAHKSVIVENRSRDNVGGGGSGAKQRSGESAPAPRPLSPQSQYKLLLQQHYPQQYIGARPDLKVGSLRASQSPLGVSSPQQITHAIMQPLELQKAMASSGKSAAETSTVNSSHMYSASQYLATIAQPPVSLPSNVSHSLIQQGLIPKPEHSSAMNSTKVSNCHDGRVPSTDLSNNSSLSALATMTPPGMQEAKKRASAAKDLSKGAKKPKPDSHVTMSSLSSGTSGAGGTLVTSSAAAALLLPGLDSAGKTTGGFMDSFRSFVESTVQNAFYQETEIEKANNHPKNRHKTSQSTTAPAPLPSSLHVAQQEQKQSKVHSGQTNLSNVPQSSPVTSQPEVEKIESKSTCNMSSIMETINRVANGMIDTDSDTLSAPSPPPHIRNGSSSDVTMSPNKSGNQMKLKKAWLQRHSGQDQEKASCGSQSSSESPTTKCESRDSEFGRLSPLKDDADGSKVLPSVGLGLPNGTRSQNDQDSTSSASETESQGSTSSNSVKRRVKSRRKHSDAKKSKGDGSSTGEVVGKKRSTSSRKTKEDGINSSIVADKKLIDLKNEDSRSSLSDTEVKERRKGGRKSREKAETVAVGVKQEPGALSLREVKPVFNINKPLNKVPAAKLKKSMEPFLQDGPCAEVTPKLMKCRECKMTPNQRSKKMNIFCRFYAFRRLRYSQKGFIMLAGFSESSDAEVDDIQPWMPHYPVIEPELDVEAAKYIVKHVGDQFCELVEQEKEVISWNRDGGIVAWKRAVQGVREMCDVCDTTLFNMHWVCRKCGFVVCLDCYRLKKDKPVSEFDLEDGVKEGDKDEHHWLKCSANRQPHEASKLMLTQIIPANSLWQVGELIHDIRQKWSIRSRCPCGKSNDLVPANGIHGPMVNGVGGDSHFGKVNGLGGKGFDDPLTLLADVASMDSEKTRGGGDKGANEGQQGSGKVKGKVTAATEYPFQDTKAVTGTTQTFTGSPPTGGSSKNGSIFDIDTIDADKKGSSCATLRELLTKKVSSQQNTSSINSNDNNRKMVPGGPRSKARSLEEIIQTVVEKDLPRDGGGCGPTVAPQEHLTTVKLVHYVPRSGHHLMGRREQVRAHTLTETSVLFPDVPHSWLNEGRLLRLHDPGHRNNLPLFQQQWRLGQPVLVSNVTSKMKLKELWMPETFSREFGHLENDLVNCKNGVVLIGHDMRDFWDGFESMAKRVCDEETGEPLILKLKDWPPGDDFSDLLPTRFQDLMQALPLPEYTQRSGRLNLAARLPDFFVKPDLGPKMYNAFGMASHPREATTNLHLDISDAVNVMVHVGVPAEIRAEQEAAALKAIDDVGCDIITRRRVREGRELPGALWHIFDAHDADKIRDLLNKVAKEQGEVIEPHHDPIHDQSWYLDGALQTRLKDEYGVEGYQIVQCAGDAVFIPAGAPHQVRNLHSCIKVAEDFVSPEHLSHCFRMTQEFRLLSDTHSNHEDKLQVKNIIFHAVKDAVAVLNANDPKTTRDLDY